MRVKLGAQADAGSIAVPVDVSWHASRTRRRYRLQTQRRRGAVGRDRQDARRRTLTADRVAGRRYVTACRRSSAACGARGSSGPSAVRRRASSRRRDVTFTGDWQSAPTKRAYSELPVYASARRRASATYQLHRPQRRVAGGQGAPTAARPRSSSTASEVADGRPLRVDEAEPRRRFLDVRGRSRARTRSASRSRGAAGRTGRASTSTSSIVVSD